MLRQDLQNNLEKVVSKAWADPLFKERLKTEPKAVLSEMGINTPESVDIEVLENTNTKTYLTLPVTPPCDHTPDHVIEDIAPKGTLDSFATRYPTKRPGDLNC